ncbi:hypothetical protein L195_g041453, partial [Trifolium pratense]
GSSHEEYFGVSDELKTKRFADDVDKNMDKFSAMVRGKG